MKYGYARVSTDDQDLSTQIYRLTEYGCDRIYQEKISGGKADRPELNKLLDSIGPGDTIVIVKLDRLGRSINHLFKLLERFQREGVTFVSLSDNFDTTTAAGRVILHMMVVFAEFERGLISERTRAKLGYLKAQGRKLGRKEVPLEVQAAIRARYANDERICDIAHEFKLSRETVRKYITIGNTGVQPVDI